MFESLPLSSTEIPAIVNWEEFPLALRAIIDDLNDYMVRDRSARYIASEAINKVREDMDGTLSAEVATSPRSKALDAFAECIGELSQFLSEIHNELENLVKRDRAAREEAVKNLTEALFDLNKGLDLYRAKPKGDDKPHHKGDKPPGDGGK